MSNLKPWFQTVYPREDLRTGKPLDASEFAVHLDHVRAGRAPDDYQKPDRFFDRTYLTSTLRDLAAQVIRRLSGERLATSAVFNMATQFGGGKTHALTLLYHLAEGGASAVSWRGVQSIIDGAGVPSVPRATTAVFVGTEFDSLAGRGGDDGTPRRLTPWGEVAWQLGRDEGYAKVAEHDQRGIAPGGDVIRSFLPAGPLLILMDELMNYISRNQRTGLAAQLYNFIQNLAEEARARDNVVLVVSIPASELEMNPVDQLAFESVKKLLDRVGKAVVMSAENETAEIIRRRLFEWGGLPNDGLHVANEFADWAIANRPRLGDVDVDSIRDRFQATYPIHPATLSVFERKWQGLPRFQRTRGVLRLLALWVSRAYESGYRGAHRDPLIGLGTAPLDDPYFRAALFEQLGSDQLEVSVTTDIAGGRAAHALRLDHEADDDIKKARLHLKVATTIFFESNGGMARAEATVPEIRFAVGEPDLDIVNVETVLDGLGERCYFLSSERNRYRYSLSPNLNKVLTDRRASIQPRAIDERVRQEIQAVFRKGTANPTRVFFPDKSGQIADHAVLTLVVLDPGRPWPDPATSKQIETFVREHGQTSRTFKSALLFVVAEATTAIRDDAKALLAWNDVADDQETLKRLDDSQKQQLTTGQKKAAGDLSEAVWRTYRYVVLLAKDNSLKEVDLGLVHSSMAGSTTELVVNRLRQDDEITDSVGPHKLVRYWPGNTPTWRTKAARDAFFSSPLLPRLLDPNAIRRTIVDGVAQKVLAYAVQRPDGTLDRIYFGDSLSESDVEISDEVVLLTAEEATRRIEPPRLARLQITPATLWLKTGEQMSFAATAQDQYGQQFAVDTINWSASNGVIDVTGRYTAPSEPGSDTVVARLDAVSAAAQVTVEASSTVGPDSGPGPGPGPDPGPIPGSGIRWHGDLPLNKWMNFYMKVLTRFAHTPGVVLRVELAVPGGDGLTDTKVDETRTALRELGLNEGVERT